MYTEIEQESLLQSISSLVEASKGKINKAQNKWLRIKKDSVSFIFFSWNLVFRASMRSSCTIKHKYNRSTINKWYTTKIWGQIWSWTSFRSLLGHKNLSYNSHTLCLGAMNIRIQNSSQKPGIQCILVFNLTKWTPAFDETTTLFINFPIILLPNRCENTDAYSQIDRNRDLAIREQSENGEKGERTRRSRRRSVKI